MLPVEGLWIINLVPDIRFPSFKFNWLSTSFIPCQMMRPSYLNLIMSMEACPMTSPVEPARGLQAFLQQLSTKIDSIQAEVGKVANLDARLSQLEAGPSTSGSGPKRSA